LCSSKTELKISKKVEKENNMNNKERINKKESGEITRRDFMKDAGLLVGGAAISSTVFLAACEGEEVTETITATETTTATVTEKPWLPDMWDYEADVVIVGAGGTGLCAAIEARTAGATVILLEKAVDVGGSTKLSGGVIQAAGTKAQEDAGVIGDTPDAHKEYWLKASEGIADPVLVKALADNAASNIEWLIAQGLNYITVYPVDPIPYVDPSLLVPRIHVAAPNVDSGKGSGAGLVEILYKTAQEKGPEFMLETPVKALIHDPEKGVIGVKAENGGGDIYVKARRGVILATSGFDRNEEMSRSFSPQQLWELQTGSCACAPTNTGDGIKLAMEVGADLAGLGGTIGYPATAIGRAEATPGIWINKYGQRFTNEAGHYAYVIRAVYDQLEHIAWAVLDGKVEDWTPDLSGDIASGKVKTGDTVMALAGSIGVNAAQLEATLEKWNQDSELGEDTLFHNEVGLATIDTPPFFATKVTSWNLGSCGGVKINPKAQVIDVNAKPIPRLYAGGSMTGGIIGPYYPGSGTAIATLLQFGRVAGQQAAALDPWD
jgi:fumarate reductase flavoprotein subunit